MSRALLIIDVQNDFCEGGSMGVVGGAATAAAISSYLDEHVGEYSHVIASRDWHDGDNSNGGHFAEPGGEPDFKNSWPRHCVSGEPGAEYHPNLDTARIDIHIRKGMGKPAYSIFEGVTEAGEEFPALLERLGVTEVDVVGIATDYCVLASSLDARAAGLGVRVLSGLTAAVDAETGAAALARLVDSGVAVS